MMIEVKIPRAENGFKIPKGELADSDWFTCMRCGYEERKLAMGPFATCPKCSGTMVRKGHEPN